MPIWGSAMIDGARPSVFQNAWTNFLARKLHRGVVAATCVVGLCSGGVTQAKTDAIEIPLDRMQEVCLAYLTGKDNLGEIGMRPLAQAEIAYFFQDLLADNAQDSELVELMLAPMWFDPKLERPVSLTEGDRCHWGWFVAPDAGVLAKFALEWANQDTTIPLLVVERSVAPEHDAFVYHCATWPGGGILRRNMVIGPFMEGTEMSFTWSVSRRCPLATPGTQIPEMGDV